MGRQLPSQEFPGNPGEARWSFTTVSTPIDQIPVETTLCEGDYQTAAEIEASLSGVGTVGLESGYCLVIAQHVSCRLPMKSRTPPKEHPLRKSACPGPGL